MANSQAITAYLSSISVNDGSGNTHVDWLEVRQITEPNPQPDEIDVTHLESDDFTKEYIPGWKDTSECSFTVNYIETEYARAWALKGVTKQWKITDPDGGIITFDGYVRSISRPLEVGNSQIICTIGIRVSGEVTLT